MREFKFRVWDEILKVMYNPEKDKNIPNLWENISFEAGLLKKRDGIIVMQFTGKYDCKGTAIYEGDIVEFDKDEWGSDDNVFEVKWNEDEAEWCWGGGTTGDMEWRTVIGNIYQNNEMICTEN